MNRIREYKKKVTGYLRHFYSIHIYMYSWSKNTPINSNTNYGREMKHVPINMDYCLLQFGALKFFLKVPLHVGGGSTKL